MDGIKNVYTRGKEYAIKMYYPTSLRHFVYIAIYFIVTFYITDYFLNFKLIRWIYVGTLIVIIASLYHEPTKENEKKIAADLFKLATL